MSFVFNHARGIGRIALIATSSVLASVCCAQDAPGGKIEEFYRNKTLEFFIGYTPGGGYDAYARLVGRYLGRHIPGNPKIMPRNMPGGGSRLAAGYVYNVAPKDGTVLATGDQSLALEQAMGDRAIQFDAAKFNWIGNVISDNNTVVSWYASGIKTIEDAKNHDVPIGSTGADPSSQYPRAMNALLGTRFKIVLGYPGANEINMAMENGEVAGRGSNSWASWKATKPDWVKEKKINILVQIGLSKASDLPTVPLLAELAKNAEDEAVLKLLSQPVGIGRPIFTTPGVPSDRIKALRDAFDATVKDPAFVEEARAANLAINPISGAELQKLVMDILSSPREITTRLSSIIGAPAAKEP
jgi:tripartite-type tricarboxylate transporter receptor subunit TctC